MYFRVGLCDVMQSLQNALVPSWVAMPCKVCWHFFSEQRICETGTLKLVIEKAHPLKTMSQLQLFRADDAAMSCSLLFTANSINYGKSMHSVGRSRLARVSKEPQVCQLCAHHPE